MTLKEFQEILSMVIINGESVQELLTQLGHVARFENGLAYLIDFGSKQDLDLFRVKTPYYSVSLMKFSDKETFLEYICSFFKMNYSISIDFLIKMYRCKREKNSILKYR